MYGGRKRSEYMNAGVYVLATILLTGGFAAQLSGEPKSGLALLLIGFGIIMIVNLHDLIAHLAPIDYRLPTLMDLDLQLALVEFAVPLLYIFGTILFFLPTLFLFIQVRYPIILFVFVFVLVVFSFFLSLYIDFIGRKRILLKLEIGKGWCKHAYWGPTSMGGWINP